MPSTCAAWLLLPRAWRSASPPFLGRLKKVQSRETCLRLANDEQTNIFTLGDGIEHGSAAFRIQQRTVLGKENGESRVQLPTNGGNEYLRGSWNSGHGCCGDLRRSLHLSGRSPSLQFCHFPIGRYRPMPIRSLQGTRITTVAAFILHRSIPRLGQGGVPRSDGVVRSTKPIS